MTANLLHEPTYLSKARQMSRPHQYTSLHTSGCVLWISRIWSEVSTGGLA